MLTSWRYSNTPLLHPLRLSCKRIFQMRSDPAWVKSQQSEMTCFLCLFLHPTASSASLRCLSRDGAKHASFHQNTVDNGMEIYPIWELKNASASPLCSANAPSIPHSHAASIPHTERHSAASLGTACKCALWPSEPRGEDRKRQGTSAVTAAEKWF